MRVRRQHVLAVLAALGGLLLFAYAVRRAGGFSEVIAGVGRVGWGLVPILAIAGIRFALRAECWRRCMPPDTRMPFRRAFTAYLSGDAIGNLTPLGLIASEPTKVFLVRHQLATREAAASLAIDIVVYALSALAMIATGAVVLLATVDLSTRWRLATAAGLAAFVVGAGVSLRLMRGRVPRDRVSRLWTVFLLHLVFHVFAAAELFLALALLLGTPPTIAQAVIFSALDRAVIIAFKFVPYRIGVDEAASGVLATLLGFPSLTGVTLAVVKKVRSLAWTGVGLLLIAAHPAAPDAPAARETDRP
jgi:hypothetical protein